MAINKEYNDVQLDVKFTQASTRANLVSEENISVSFGKISKYFADLHSQAFTGYSHPTYTERSKDIYKFHVNTLGHVDDATALDKTDVSTLINKLDTGSSTPVDADYYISQYVGGGATTTSYHRRPMSALWSYVKSKADSVYLPIGHTYPLSIAADSGTNQLTLSASTKYKLTAGGNTFVFTTPPDTTYSAGNHLSLSSTTFSIASYCKSITDWNSATTNGWYMGSSVTNAPSTAWWFGRVVAYNNKYCMQEVWQFTASTDGHKVPHKMRMFVNNVWGNWTDITVGTQVPENAVFTDTKVTSSANHYTPATASGGDISKSASGATAAWSIDVVKGVTLNTDGKGHVTGISVTSGKIPGNPNTDRYVNSAAFADDSTNTAASPVKMTLTRAGSDTATVTANIPKVSSSSAGVAPKGAKVSTQSQSTKFLREDGSWAAPSYTSIPSNNVTGSGTSGYLTKWNGTNTVTNGPQLGSSTTTYLRNDGSWATPPDTKNTAGSTDTSSKIFLIGATTQAANPQTYSDNEVYTTSGVLTTKKIQVGGGSCTMEYNSTTQTLDFVFA